MIVPAVKHCTSQTALAGARDNGLWTIFLRCSSHLEVAVEQQKGGSKDPISGGDRV